MPSSSCGSCLCQRRGRRGSCGPILSNGSSMPVMLAREGEGRGARLEIGTPATFCPGIVERVWDTGKAVARGEDGGGGGRMRMWKGMSKCRLPRKEKQGCAW